MSFIQIKLINGEIIKGDRANFNFANKESVLWEDDISYKMGNLTKYIPKKSVVWIDVESEK